MTGLGESIIRIAVAKEIANLLERGISPAKATTLVLRKVVKRTNGLAGALVLRADGLDRSEILQKSSSDREHSS